MDTRPFSLVVIVFAAVVLQGCAGANADSVATRVAATLQISQLETAAAGAGQPIAGGENGGQSGGGASEGSEVAATITPSSTTGVALVSVDQDTNCRRGPRVDYGLVTAISAGQQVEVLQTFPGANYVVVRNPSGSGDCWLWLQYADQTDFSSFGLPVATQPPTPTASSTPTNTPTPTPAFNWTGTWTIWVDGGSTSMAANQSSSSFSATWDAGAGYTVTLTGSTSSDGQQVSGNWSTSIGTTGTFQFRMMANLNQFQGNIDGSTGPWCGARNGAGQPAPCQWP